MLNPLAIALFLGSSFGLFFACGTAAPIATRVVVDNRFTLAVGATASVEGTGMRIRFDRVPQDSRCPTDVNCVQAGDAIVDITVIQDAGSTQSYQLHTSGPRSIVHDGLRVSLEELSPQPVSSRPIAQGDYRATFRASR